MHAAELPLLIFTILGQMSVGAFVVLGAINVLGRPIWGSARIEELSDVALYAIGPTLVLGFAGSFLHLGNPINSANAMNHVLSSSMSREILAGVLFAAVGGVYAVCQLLRIGPATLRQALAVVTALLGVVLVWCMSALYLLPTVPVWNSWTTPVSFYATAGLLGTMAIATALVIRLRTPLPLPRLGRRRSAPAAGGEDTPVDLHDGTSRTLLTQTLTWLLVAAMVMLAVIVVVSLAQLAGLAGHSEPAARQSLAILTEHGGLWLVLRIVLSVIGTGVLGMVMLRLRTAPEDRAARAWRILPTIVIVAFVLVLAGEVVGRLLFYSSYARIGM